MTADDKGAGRFYCNFKVHKEHNDIPPPRLITSGSGSSSLDLMTIVAMSTTVLTQPQSHISTSLATAWQICQ